MDWVAPPPWNIQSSLYCTQYMESGDLFSMIMFILKTMSNAPVVIVVVILTMIALTDPVIAITA